MNRLKFGSQQFSKRPNMIRQSCRHARGSMVPLGLDESRGVWFLIRQRYAQTHVRPGKVGEGLEENHAPPHLGAILTAVPSLADKGRQGMTQGEVETLKHTGADRQPQFFQPLGTAAYPVDQFLETALLLLLEHLAVDQL